MDILKGNFKSKKPVNVEKPADKNPEEEFESEALRRLGGSIAYVAKKKIAWDLEE